MSSFKHPILNSNLFIDQGTLARTCSTLPVVTGLEQSVAKDNSFFLEKNIQSNKNQCFVKKIIVLDKQSLPCNGRGNEVLEIVNYMVKEMSINAKSEIAKKMLILNNNSDFKTAYSLCIKDWASKPWHHRMLVKPDYCFNIALAKKMNKIDAIVKWATKVAQNSDWDHKPYIRKTFHPAVPNGEQAWHSYENYLYYYDIWSNIHYGYVGVACGFSESELLDGAGLEQIGSDIVRWKWPSGSENIEGLRAFDDPSDRKSISIGISLYQTYSENITSQIILSVVKNASELAKKPCV